MCIDGKDIDSMHDHMSACVCLHCRVLVRYSCLQGLISVWSSSEGTVRVRIPSDPSSKILDTLLSWQRNVSMYIALRTDSNRTHLTLGINDKLLFYWRAMQFGDGTQPGVRYASRKVIILRGDQFTTGTIYLMCRNPSKSIYSASCIVLVH